MIRYPLRLGSISIGDESHPFEGPDGFSEGLGDLGRKLNVVVRELPGGIIAAQSMGSFPKVISWSGKLFGANAIERSFQLQRLNENEEIITFSYAQWNIEGFVQDYSVKVVSPTELHYKITFQSLDDNSTGAGNQSAQNSDPFAGTISNAQNTATQQANTPASGTSLPSPVTPAVSNLNNSITQALQNSGGSVINIPTSTLQNLQSQISNLQQILQPLINGLDPLLASAAADLAGTLGIMAAAFNGTTEPLITTLQIANPDLYQLAAKFYKNPTLYYVIQQANGLKDPLPVTNGPILLKIPVKPTLTSITRTVMSDAISAA